VDEQRRIGHKARTRRREGIERRGSDTAGGGP
jgi:hypothetical protein